MQPRPNRRVSLQETSKGTDLRLMLLLLREGAADARRILVRGGGVGAPEACSDLLLEGTCEPPDPASCSIEL